MTLLKASALASCCACDCLCFLAYVSFFCLAYHTRFFLLFLFVRATLLLLIVLVHLVVSCLLLRSPAWDLVGFCFFSVYYVGCAGCCKMGIIFFVDVGTVGDDFFLSISCLCGSLRVVHATCVFFCFICFATWISACSSNVLLRLPRWPRRFMGRLVILFLFQMMSTLIIAG